MSKAAAQPSLQPRLIEAMRLHVQGQLEAARSAYERLLADYPAQPDILHALGTIALQTEQWQKAIEYFSQAPKHPRHLLPLARALAGAGEIEKSMSALVEILSIDQNHEEAHNLLRDLCLPEAQAKGIANSAITRLIVAQPKALGLRSVAISLSRTLGDHAERLRQFEALYKSGQRSENLYHEYGKALKDNGQFERGLAVVEEGLEAHPQSLALLKLRGDFYLSLGEYAKAMQDGLEIIRRDPDDHYARTTIGIIKLMTSGGKEGYEEYAAHRDYALSVRDIPVPLPEWQGEPLKGKRLFIWSSQGIGDIIMFSGLLPWVFAQGAHVTLAVYPKLMALFARSFPQAQVIAYTAEAVAEHAPACDFHIILGKLMPHALPHYVPAEHSPYLKTDKAQAQALRRKYLGAESAYAKATARQPSPETACRVEATEQRRLVGISWHTVNADTFSQRNIALTQWLPLIELPHIQFLSLQYGDHAAEIEAVNRQFPGALITDDSINALEDVDALAAQICACDEVISIQNSTVHLAGALGVPTTLLLSAASEWRWGLKRTDNRWYQSVTIERQEKIGQWQPVLAHVRQRLEGSNE